MKLNSQVTTASLLLCLITLTYAETKKPPSYSTDDLFIAVENGKRVVINRQGKVVLRPNTIPGMYQMPSEGLIAFGVRGKGIGYTNIKGEVVIPAKFGQAMPFHKGYAMVKRPKDILRWSIIDRAGNYIFNETYLHISPSSPNDPWYCRDTQDKSSVFFIDKTGKVVIPAKFEDARPFWEGLAPAKTNGKWGFIDRTGAFVIAPQYEGVGNLTSGLATAKSAGQWGYLNKAGHWAIEPQFPGAGSFGNGLASVVRADLKAGYINTEGDLVIPYQFERGYDFSDGRAAVVPKIDENTVEFIWGYIDTQGKMVIEPQFTVALPFRKGLAMVNFSDGRDGYIDRSGNSVWINTKKTEQNN